MHEEAISKLKEIFSKDGAIRVITHLDTDGLTSATILINALKKFNQSFWLTTVKQLEDDMLDRLLKDAGKQKWKAIFFLDLGSSKLRKIKEFSNYLPLFVIDHHELDPLYELEKEKDKENGEFFLTDKSQYNNEEMSASCLTYLFVKKLDKSNKPLSQLAILGLIGDVLDKNIGKNVQTIIEDAKDSGMQVKRGLTVFSAMRPVHKALEFSSNIFIPGVTGNTNGAIIMLRDLGIDIRNAKGYRTLLDLSKEELSRLITAILLRRANYDNNQEIINNIYLVKISNHIWDAKEISTMMNACGRLNYSSLAIAFLMGSKKARDKIEDVYTKYKHHIIQSLNIVNNIDKIIGEKYVIINAKKMIKDTMIGTIISILTSSFLYKEGTIIVGMAYRKDRKIKVSARVVRGRENNDEEEINLDHVLRSVISVIGGEVGGHLNAAGCLISRKKENEFVELLRRSIDTEQIRIVA